HHPAIDFVTRLMNARRITQDDLALGCCDHDLDAETRGLRFIGDRGDLLPDETIEQRRLPRIRPPNQRDIPGVRCSIRAQLFSAKIWIRLINVSVDFSSPRRELNSSLPWKFVPPVKRFGVGNPRNVKFDPSVPPRIGFRKGFKPARRAASIALFVRSGKFFSTSFMFL